MTIALLRSRFRGPIGRWILAAEIGVRKVSADYVAPLLRAIEVRDAIFGTGFAVAWYGGYHISKPWSFVAAGLAIMLVALLLMNSPSEDE